MRKVFLVILLLCALILSSCGAAPTMQTTPTITPTPITTPASTIVSPPSVPPPNVKLGDYYRNNKVFPSYGNMGGLKFMLGKGERIEATITIMRADSKDKRIPATPLVLHNIIFYIMNSSNLVVYDAGRIAGTYYFNYTAEYSGEYRLIFDHTANGECILDMYYNLYLSKD